MNRRCVNNLSGYCSDTPRCEKHSISLGSLESPQVIYLDSYEIGTCAPEGEPCRFFLTWDQEHLSTDPANRPG